MIRILLVIALILLAGSLVACCVRSKYQLPPESSILEEFGSTAQTSLGNTINVLVWNVYKGRVPGWKDDFRHLVDQADLILVQEAYLPSPMAELFRSFAELHWDYAKSYRYIATGNTTGVAIGSKAKSLTVGYLRSPSREPLVGTPKMAILTEYSLQGREENLLVVNNHALLVVSTSRFGEQMMRIASEIKKHRGPVIWAGDFNTWSSSRLELIKKITAELGLHPVQFEPDKRTHRFDQPIDHAFIREFEVISSRVHDVVETSDHKALEFVLQAIIPGS